MADSRTVDNLGVDASNRFATDQATFDPTYVKESTFISIQTGADVVTPFYKGEATTLFETGARNVPEGEFEAPPPSYRLFTHSLIPSLGSDDKIEAVREKIEALPNKEEGSQLLDFYDAVEKLNRDFHEINNKRNQFSKG